LSFCCIRLAFEERRGGIGHLAHALRGVTSASPGENRRALQKISAAVPIFLAMKRL
jgi:hypothetical protein